MKRLVVTGGHHTSALPVALELQKLGWEIVWLGHRRSMRGDEADSAEYTDVTSSGIKFHNLWAGKFYRTYNPLKLALIPIGFLHSLLYLAWYRPQGIVSFGGYLAVPVVIVGWLLGIKAITHEQTVVTGWGNQVVAKFAQKVTVTWPSGLKHYPASKGVYVGLPLRPEIVDARKKHHAKKVYEPITVYVTGGKQGAHVINELIFANLQRLVPKHHLIHQTGTSTLYGDWARASDIHVPGYQAFGFDAKKAIAALQKADVVVSRAGAHTVYELAVLGKRSVLIPIPWVSHSEQEQNAQVLVDAGLGVILPESKLNIISLQAAIDRAKHLAGQPVNLPLQATQALAQLIEKQFM